MIMASSSFFLCAMNPIQGEEAPQDISAYREKVESFQDEDSRLNYVIDSQEHFKQLISSYREGWLEHKKSNISQRIGQYKNRWYRIEPYEKLVSLLCDDPKTLNCILNILAQLEVDTIEPFIKETFEVTEEFLIKKFSFKENGEEETLAHLSLLIRPNIYDRELQEEVAKHKRKIRTWLLSCNASKKKLPKFVRNKIINFSYDQIVSSEKMKPMVNGWSELCHQIKSRPFEDTHLGYTVMTTLGEKECSKNSFGRGDFTATNFDDWFLEKKERLFGVANFEEDSLLGKLCLG